MDKMRLDVSIVKRHLLSSREKAKQAILAGQVMVNQTVCVLAKYGVDEKDVITVAPEASAFIGRGAHKLEYALKALQINLTGKHVLDIGASTGGFTQVCLEHGAATVCALDVGTNQLVQSLREDKRVQVMEQHNFRHAEKEWFTQPFDFICCDVSFISLTHIIAALHTAVKEDTVMVLLLKPQFEAGAKYLNKHGVVTSKQVHVRVIQDIVYALQSHGYFTYRMIPSPILGKDGNIEYLLHVGCQSGAMQEVAEDVVKQAFC